MSLSRCSPTLSSFLRYPPLTYMLGSAGALLAGGGLAEHEDTLLHLVGLFMLVGLLVGASLDALLSNHDECLSEMVEGGGRMLR